MTTSQTEAGVSTPIKPTVIIWLTEQIIHETKKINASFSIIDGTSERPLHDWDLTKDLRQLSKIHYQAYVSDFCAMTMHVPDNVFFDGYQPSAHDLQNVIPQMKRLDKAIDKRFQETEDRSFASAITALVLATKAERIHYRSRDLRNSVERIKKGAVYARVANIAKEYLERYGKPHKPEEAA